MRVSDEEVRLRRRILRLTSEGKPKEATRFYEREQPFLVSAATHHAAFVAAHEAGAGIERLARIETRALRCADYDASELDFNRDWALRYAEVERDFSVAEAMIKEVIRSRSDDEGQDRSQLPIDELARCKILLLGGRVNDAMAGLHKLREHVMKPNSQLWLDVEWWYFVATLVFGRNVEARRLARKSLATGLDPKPSRYHAWRFTAIPIVGPSLTRVIIKRKLGL